jgi:hypothetical protein
METQKQAAQREYPAPEDHHRGRPAQEDANMREFGQETSRVDALANKVSGSAAEDRLGGLFEALIDRFDLWARTQLGNGNGNGNHTVVRPEWPPQPRRPDWSYSGIDTAPEHRAFDYSIGRLENAFMQAEARAEARDLRLEKCRL